jgi:hypothetical protein
MVSADDGKKRSLEPQQVTMIDKRLRVMPPPVPGELNRVTQYPNQWQQQPISGMGMGMSGIGMGMGTSGGPGQGWPAPQRAAVAVGGGVGATSAATGVMTDTQRQAAAQLEEIYGQLEKELSHRPDLRPMLADIRIAVAQGKPMGLAIEQLTRALEQPPQTLPLPMTAGGGGVGISPMVGGYRGGGGLVQQQGLPRGSSPPRVVPALHNVTHIPNGPINSGGGPGGYIRNTNVPNTNVTAQSIGRNVGGGGGAGGGPTLAPLFASSSQGSAPLFAREPSFEQDYLKK